MATDDEEPEIDETAYLEIEQLQTNFQTVDIKRLIFTPRSSIEQLLSKRNVEVILDLSPEPVMISTDSFIAKHVFINLLSVIVQKSEGKTVRVTVKSSEDKTVLNVSFFVPSSSDESLINDITLAFIHRLKWEVTQDVRKGTRRNIQCPAGSHQQHLGRGRGQLCRRSGRSGLGLRRKRRLDRLRSGAVAGGGQCRRRAAARSGRRDGSG